MEALVRSDLKGWSIPATWRISKRNFREVYLWAKDLKGSKVMSESDIGMCKIRLKDKRIVMVDSIDLDFKG